MNDQALEPFAAELARQERVRSYRDGDCYLVDCRLTIGDLRRLCDGAPAQGALWQPIDTAPLDGTVVLITGGTFEVSNSMAGEIQSAGVSMAAYDEWEKLWCGDNAGGHDEYYWHKPTHWMALPKPPALTSTTRCPEDS